MPAIDPRLVELYDLDNPDGVDHDYFRAVADRLRARTIVDLGCGTGMLTVSWARPGRRIIGVDPDPEMLEFARNRPGRDHVEWVLGDSRAIGRVDADLVVMSGNVAQHIIGPDWARTLSDVRAALRPGGTVAFESRNPAVRAWTQWKREQTYRTRDTANGPLTEWMEVTAITPDTTVTFVAHNIFEATGEHLVYTDSLAFRDRAQIETDLTAAGLNVSTVCSGWQDQPFDADAAVMVFQATRPIG